MKQNKYLLPTALTAVLTLALLGAVVCRTFFPRVIFPAPDIPGMVLLSLAALLLDHYCAPEAPRSYPLAVLFSAAAFGLLPYAAGFAAPAEGLKLALGGGCVFPITTWLYTGIRERLSSGPKNPLAPLLSALGLYLAAQCFAGWQLF